MNAAAAAAAATTKPIRIQYVSDIHMEHYPGITSAATLQPERWIVPDPTAAALFLAGDIGFPEKESYFYFLEWCSEHWPKVFVVAGNHEFYNLNNSSQQPYTTSEKLRLMKQAASAIEKGNVHILDKDAVELQPGLWVLGCTLWSNVPQDMYYDAMTSMNDYKLIWTDIQRQTTVDDTNIWHQEDLSWLIAMLEKIKERGAQALVLTHHLPTYLLINARYKGHPLNCCFASNLDKMIKDLRPLAWICGHSHLAGKASIGQTQLALNPHGYPGERVPTRESKAILEIAAKE
jgi:hypothetical protein